MDANSEDMSATAKKELANASVQTKNDNREPQPPRIQDAASTTNELLAKLLDAVKEQTQRNNEGFGNIFTAVNGQPQHNGDDPAALLGNVKSIHTSLRKLEPKEEKLRSGEYKRAEGKKWPKDKNYFEGRLKYYERKWKDVGTEFSHLETHYVKVGGDRGVIEASRAFRTALCHSVGPLRDVHKADYQTDKVRELKNSEDYGDKTEGIKLEKTLENKYRGYRETAANCVEELSMSAKKLHESLYVQKHAFYFRKMGECCNVLENANLDLGSESSILTSILDSLFQPMELVMFELVKEMQAFRDKALPVFLTEEKERITNKYLNITTIATFFSSVTATALAISLQTGNNQSTYAAVNLFWFVSLVFSVSSGVSSLVGMLWHNSRIFYSNPPPPEVWFWFERSPIVSLIIAALTFVVGLNIYVYVSAQTFFVSRVTSACTGLHIVCIVYAVLWFLCQLYKGHKWATFLINIAERLRTWLTSISHIPSKVKTFPRWIENKRKQYENNVDLRRNIYWAMRLDDRVGVLNVLAVQEFDPESTRCTKPHLAARVVRAILVPFKILKDCKYWISSIVLRKAVGKRVPPLGNGNQIDLVEKGERPASELLRVAEFRKLLNRTFGSKSTAIMMAEIDKLDWMICASLGELMTQRDLRLEALFWGHRELLLKFRRTCLPLLRQCQLQEITYFNSGGTTEIYKVLDGRKIHALKVARLRGSNDLRMKREYDVRMRTKLCHTFVLPLHGVCHYFYVPIFGTLHRPQHHQLCLAFPLMENGNLSDYVRKYPVIDCTSLLLELAQGVQYLHGLNVIHGNLKPTIVLIDDQGHPKISSFGSAHISYMDLPFYGDSPSMNDRYTAPEIYHLIYSDDSDNKPDDSDWRKKSMKQSDIHGFAQICFEVYTRKQPWKTVRVNLIPIYVCKGRRPDRPEERVLTDDVWALIERCWAHDPRKRPTIEEVIQELCCIRTEELASQLPIASSSRPQAPKEHTISNEVIQEPSILMEDLASETPIVSTSRQHVDSKGKGRAKV